jgi:glycosyltransferase involved in cell wall biosynthesis
MSDHGENKKRILIINLYTEMGGNETALLNILRNTDTARFAPVMMFNARGPFVEKVESLGIETAIIPYRVVMLRQLFHPAVLWQTLRSSQQIYGYIREHKTDILQCSDVLSLLLILFAKLRIKIPVVYNVSFFHEWSRMILFNFLAIVMVRKIVVNSFPVQRDIMTKTFFLKRRISVINNGVDTSVFHPSGEKDGYLFRSQLNIPSGVKLVGMAARFDPAKGHDIFLEAAAQILKQRNDIRFVVIGGGDIGGAFPAFKRYRDVVMRRHNKLGLEGMVTFVGHRDDMPEIMRELDLLVCPSFKEGFGLVVLEALASGIPVVASRGVGITDALHSIKGLYIAENDNISSFIEQIQFALQEINSAPEPEQMKRFDWHTTADKFAKLYAELLPGMA